MAGGGGGGGCGNRTLLRLEPYGAAVLGLQAVDVTFPLSGVDRAFVADMLCVVDLSWPHLDRGTGHGV